MKALDFYASGEEDYLRLSFNGVFGSRVALKSELEPFFRTLEEYADGWMPDVIKGKRQRQYARAAIWKALEERRDECRYPVTLA
ncbi:hypothetical protein D187_007921 [Cystobacter fuscus DSM 2262]|uniref:Uncharacterized protein n=1 Tax=Cystobacter fuscus (strain ATCC 25194 / DSM 2262 / NBRC 100088 / M29) TaxID=1242864 RepID=S9Q5I4_CYSF2|nr:hypothetical protein [Cystobacter fuscus]EPX56579.1 hypothetical protein D187_007921 [Cystobacter fuscus DSM 2262]